MPVSTRWYFKTSPNTLDRGKLNSSAVDGYTAKLGEIVRIVSGFDTIVMIPDQVSLLLARQWYTRVTQTVDKRKLIKH